jgi:hypothetical protein
MPTRAGIAGINVPIIQKVVYSREAFVERAAADVDAGLGRQVPADVASERKILVTVGQTVNEYDFVAEVGSDHFKPRRRITAGVPGVVADILEEQAVLIRTEALIVRGVYGQGDDAEGELRVVSGISEPIREQDVVPEQSGAILVGGHVAAVEVLNKAEALGVAGIVCGGVNRLNLKKSRLPLLVIDGFGRVFFSEHVHHLLSQFTGRHVFVSPERAELLLAKRKKEKAAHEKIFARYTEESAEYFAPLKKGLKVQVFSGWHFGRIGKVVGVGDGMVDVRIDSDIMRVPVRNVGIIR